MQKVLFAFPFAIVGGIETLFATILKNISKNRFEFHAVSPYGIGAWMHKTVGPYARVFEYKDEVDLSDHIDRLQPDIAVTALSYGITKALLRSKHKPLVIETCHNLYWSVGESIKMVRPWLAHVVSVSESVDENVAKSTDFQFDRSIILTGVDLDVFRARNELNPEVRNYAYFGRLSDHEKQIVFLMEAYHRAGLYNETCLNLYGKASTEKEERHLKSLASTRYRQSRIIFKGFVDDPHRHYVHNDAIVIRSHAEGYCNTVVEAMACGIPLVAFNFRGVLDHLPPKAALISKNQNEFIQHIFDIRNYKLRLELRETALNFVRKECSATVMAEHYHELFKRVAGLKSSPVATPVTTKDTADLTYEDLADKPIVDEKETRVTQVVGMKLAGDKPKQPRTLPVRWAAVCSQHSTSIVHAMEEFGVDPYIVTYNGYFDLKKTAVVLARYQGVIFNAACPGYDPLLEALSRGGVATYALYHSCFCGFAFDHLFDHNERANLQRMLDWERKGLVRKVGFVNKGSAEYYRKLGYKAEWVPNIPSEVNEDYPPLQGRPRIGVFSNLNAMKNTITSLVCALAVPGAEVHTTIQPFDMPGIDTSKAVVHGWMQKKDLLKIMARMDVTLMLSFTESYGLLVTQSWAVGTPCIVGPACKPLLQGSNLLKEKLYVERLDDADEIVERIQWVIENRELVSEECKRQIQALRHLGAVRRDLFLESS